MNLSDVIEYYVGRKVDFLKEVSLIDRGNGIEIERWDIAEIPKPTMKVLMEFAERNLRKINRIIELREIISQEWNTIKTLLINNDYDIFYNDVNSIVENAKKELKILLPNEKFTKA